MTSPASAALHVALLHHAGGGARADGTDLHALAAGLRALGHRPTVITASSAGWRFGGENGIRLVSVPRLPESFLRRRGFSGPLTHLPSALCVLVAGRYDLVHAFTPQDALAGRLWHRVAAGPVVFTCSEVLERGSLADRRLRLRLLEGAVERSDAVLATSSEGRAALWRWLAVEAREVPTVDAAGHARLYAELLGGAAGSGAVRLTRG